MERVKLSTITCVTVCLNLNIYVGVQRVLDR
jgi:hypothetical protein